MTTESKSLSLTILGVVFWLAIAAPMMVSLWQDDAAISASEKRTLQTLPSWGNRVSLKGYFSQLTDYANDHFGFREALIKNYNSLQWKLGESPSENVIRGQDDWLFLKFKDPLHTQHKYSNKTIRNILKRKVSYLERMHTELAQREIAYAHLVVANKLNVYREYLPAIYGLTEIDATYKEFRGLTTPSVKPFSLYMTDIMETPRVEESTAWQLYLKNDTHWNDLGAYEAFLAVVENLRQRHPDLLLQPPKKEFKIYRKFSGDLAEYVGLGALLSAEEPYTEYSPCARNENLQELEWGVTASTCGVNGTVVLTIGDSFLTNFRPFFAESVGQLYSVRQTMPRGRIIELIEKYQPDVVIEEVVERNLAKPMPQWK